MPNTPVIPTWAAIGSKVWIAGSGYGYGNQTIAEAVVTRHTKTQIVVKVENRYEKRFYMPKWGSQRWEEVGTADSYRSCWLEAENSDFVTRTKLNNERKITGRKIVQEKERLSSTSTPDDIFTVIASLTQLASDLRNLEAEGKSAR